jgi:large subunit ribosomal protein L6
MSRVAKNPVIIPPGVEVTFRGQDITVKGKEGSLQFCVDPAVQIKQEGPTLTVVPLDSSKRAGALAGTTRSLVNNMVLGVNQGFQKKLQLVGVGYRAELKGQVLNLALGFSHPIVFPIPEGLTIQTLSPTEVMIKGPNKQVVGQVAANIRAYRPPEPYKGKGVRYADEVVIRKEAKKK